MAIEILLPGHTNNPDGVATSYLRNERTGGLVTQAAHAPYYEAVKRGRVFIGCNAITGVAIPIYTAKANALTLWNPAGSGYDVVILAVYVGWVSTTLVCGNLCLAQVATPGAAAGTALPILTATLATPVNARLGPSGGSSSAALFSPAVNTTTDNPTIVRTLGFSVIHTAATDVTGPFTMIDYVNGALVLAPNSAIQLVACTAVAMIATQAIVWEEVPV